MPASLEFILGLLDRDSTATVSYEDFAGAHGPALRLWQRLGFLAREPGRNPVPSCPHCEAGVPYRRGGGFLCASCHSPVDPRHLLLWRLELGAFLTWLARALDLTGPVQAIDDHLWQLGRTSERGRAGEYFFWRSGELSERERTRLLAFRSAVLLSALPGGRRIVGFRGPSVSLVELLRLEGRTLRIAGLDRLVRGGGVIRFDAESGALWADDRWLGEVPLGSKEFHLLACLSQQLDRYVAYADLKHYVLGQTGGRDSTDEATFCQKIKRRIKEKGFVPAIDRLITKTNKGDGYRLRGRVEP